MKPDLRARDIMNREVLAVRDDMTLQEVAAFLTEHQISGAPVLDAQGKLVGVVSLTDIAQGTAEAGRFREQESPHLQLQGWEDQLDPRELEELHIEEPGLLVRDIMTPVVYTIPDDTPVRDIARTMIAGRIHRLFVTRNNHLAGIVTTLDLLKILAEEEFERKQPGI